MYKYLPKNKYVLMLLALCILIVFALATALYSYNAPRSFPESAIIVVSGGDNLTSISRSLKEKNIIRSPFFFTNIVMFLRGENKVVEGEYYFDQPQNVFQVAKRVTTGAYNIDQLKTTIPEGSTAFDISMIVKKNYPLFDTVHFMTLAQGKEGYLFPDTYKFGADVRPEKIIDVLTSTFNKKIAEAELAAAIESFGRPLDDIVTMASILEGEARQTRTRQIVAGILWERMRQGIPLQVDATFRYINGKTTEDLTLEDLKIDSPYNTYLYKGLTPTPISNPGLDTIMSAVTPIETDYLYFLTDHDGNMHYAETLDEHVRNKKKYLD